MPVILQALLTVAVLVLVFGAGWWARGYHDPTVRLPRHRGGRRLFPAPVDEPDVIDAMRRALGAARSQSAPPQPGALRSAPNDGRDDPTVAVRTRLGRHVAGVARRTEEDR